MAVRLARGQRVGDRYRLDRELGRGADSVTWVATDERLDRAVAVRIFSADADRDLLVKRAAQAASLTHPRVVRVFDTGLDSGHFFTVSELLSTSLESVRLPLAPDQAVSTAIDVAEALRYAHDRGVAHGNLHEGNVLLSESGAKVGDFALAATDQPPSADDDLNAFGTVLRRMAGTDRDEPTRAAVARIVEGLDTGAYDSASRVLDDLRQLQPVQQPHMPRSRRRGWTIAVVVTLLAAVAAFGATRLGERGEHTRFAPGGRIDGTAVAISSVTDFDPLGDDEEGSRSVDNIADDDPATFWSTERYRSSPDFNGIKPGVGVILDLGTPTEVDKAQLLFSGAGCSFELRYTDDRGAPVEDWTVAATVAESPASAPIIFGSATARYWLVWITRLTTQVPGAGSAFACAVAEADLFAP